MTALQFDVRLLAAVQKYESAKRCKYYEQQNERRICDVKDELLRLQETDGNALNAALQGLQRVYVPGLL